MEVVRRDGGGEEELVVDPFISKSRREGDEEGPPSPSPQDPSNIIVREKEEEEREENNRVVDDEEDDEGGGGEDEEDDEEGVGEPPTPQSDSEDDPPGRGGIVPSSSSIIIPSPTNPFQPQTPSAPFINHRYPSAPPDQHHHQTTDPPDQGVLNSYQTPVIKPPTTASILANKYIILDPPEGSSLHTCIDLTNQRQLVSKVVGRDCWSLLSAHYRLDEHPHINSLEEVVIGEEYMYLIFKKSFGDLHSHVRQRKKLKEVEARRLFKQMAQTVAACHEQGVVLRDLKLRKFVFSNSNKTDIKLESLEDAVVLEEGEEDVLQDKRGCPAYVSPEILRSHARYSGRAADMWSLGVILYTMLAGRYPFNDSEHASLFMKISRGHFVLPESISTKAKCLIRSLLRKEPEERLTAFDVLIHPWLASQEEERFNNHNHSHSLSHSSTTSGYGSISSHNHLLFLHQDQVVPESPSSSHPLSPPSSSSSLPSQHHFSPSFSPNY